MWDPFSFHSNLIRVPYNLARFALKQNLLLCLKSQKHQSQIMPTDFNGDSLCHVINHLHTQSSEQKKKIVFDKQRTSYFFSHLKKYKARYVCPEHEGVLGSLMLCLHSKGLLAWQLWP